MSVDALGELITALRCFPGIGPKSAQRIAYHLLERDRQAALRTATALEQAVARVGHCQQCRNFSESEICGICANPARHNGQLCVVETPANVIAIEETAVYRGCYFVLMGHLSPLDGIGPAEIGLNLLEQQLQHNQVEELILAMGATVEGEATAHYIADLAGRLGIPVSRIAYGVPVGGDLEFVDGSTLSHALNSRHRL